MIYSSGFWGSLIVNRVSAEIRDDSLAINAAGRLTEIPLLDVFGTELQPRGIWPSLIIHTSSETVSISGLSKSSASQLSDELLERAKVKVAHQLNRQTSLVERVGEKTRRRVNADFYLSNTDARQWIAAFPTVRECIEHPLFDRDYVDTTIAKTLHEYLALATPTSKFRNARNAKYVNDVLTRYDSLFTSLEKHPLTGEQRRAAVIDEDRNLVIAAAGSGKSSTIAAKAVYLVERKHAKPEQILVLTYNKDAQLEIDARLAALVNKTPGYQQAIRAKTFHSLGAEIIGKTEGRSPAIAELAAASKRRRQVLFTKLIRDLEGADQEFGAKWRLFQAVAKTPLSTRFECASEAEYSAQLLQAGAILSKSNMKQTVFPLLDGREVASTEEMRIGNWLLLMGVRFEYERPYEKDTATPTHRQYYPDFYYPDADVYHEHFALNAKGEAPSFMGDYLSGVSWKRELHETNETTLIETHSAHFHDGSIFRVLNGLLKEKSIPTSPLSPDEANALVRESFSIEDDLVVLDAFLHHYKANAPRMSDLVARAANVKDPLRASLFLDVFSSFFEAYEKVLSARDEIDFEDQINRASRYLEAGDYKHTYSHILVDEFQDISQDRKRLLLALLNQRPQIKLFAVGDDWQSIYRFSGSDINIMTDFARHFGATAISYLTRTFRSYQTGVDVAAEFIQKNPGQLSKTVTSKDDTEAYPVILDGYVDDVEHDAKLLEILSKLDGLARANTTGVNVFLLARYNFDLPEDLEHLQSRYAWLKISAKTVHSSKGLEADYVVLLKVRAGRYGFPSEIEDDPLLQLVIPEPEAFPHAEERRLMYVALTRAKRATFILAAAGYRSAFAKELSKDSRVRVRDGFTLVIPCPECGKGHLVTRESQFGAFSGCSTYPNCLYKNRLPPEALRVSDDLML